MTVELKYEYRIKFKSDSGSIEHVELEGIRNKIDAYDEAREKIRQKLNLSIMEFEDSWVLEDRKLFVSFKNKPWDGFDSLKSDLESIQGVSSVFAPARLSITEPAYLNVRTDNNIDDYKVKSKIKDYFEGLIVNDRSVGFKVVINPFKFK